MEHTLNMYLGKLRPDARTYALSAVADLRLPNQSDLRSPINLLPYAGIIRAEGGTGVYLSLFGIHATLGLLHERAQKTS